jgi:hypothetical protein
MSRVEIELRIESMNVRGPLSVYVVPTLIYDAVNAIASKSADIGYRDPIERDGIKCLNGMDSNP